MSPTPFATPMVLTGPWRSPRQMLADQTYDGHTSIHDDATAARFGFTGAAIEGPTHFSQLVPLLVEHWGAAFLERGCLSAHYQNACIEGEQVQARLTVEGTHSDGGRVDLAKEDGTPVLTGTASIGRDHPETELERRLASLRSPGPLVILDQMAVGDVGAEPELVRMGFDDHLGSLYPFTLAQKLAVITEPSTWYTADGASEGPWGRPVIPLEMVSVLTSSTSHRARFRVRQPSIGLFLDQEVRMIDGPLFVDEDYELHREVIALSESRRTESWWVRTEIRHPASGRLVATTILNSGVFKESYQPT